MSTYMCFNIIITRPTIHIITLVYWPTPPLHVNLHVFQHHHYTSNYTHHYFSVLAHTTITCQPTCFNIIITRPTIHIITLVYWPTPPLHVNLYAHTILHINAFTPHHHSTLTYLRTPPLYVNVFPHTTTAQTTTTCQRIPPYHHCTQAHLPKPPLYVSTFAPTTTTRQRICPNHHYTVAYLPKPPLHGSIFAHTTTTR